MPVSIPPAFRAAEIALVALKQNRATSWADLEKRGIDPRLTDDQLDLIHQEMDTVSNLQLVTGKPISVTYCPECGRMAYIGAGGVPAKCTLKFACKGSPVKAASTKKKEVPVEEIDPLAVAIAAAAAADQEALQRLAKFESERTEEIRGFFESGYLIAKHPDDLAARQADAERTYDEELEKMRNSDAVKAAQLGAPVEPIAPIAPAHAAPEPDGGVAEAFFEYADDEEY